MKQPATYYLLSEKASTLAAKLKGPIVIFGAGGFIGVNLLNSLLMIRDDVYGISQDAHNNWRFLASEVSKKNVLSCDITDSDSLREVLKKLKPKTIFNLAAYGAYSKQKEYKKIYATNFNSTVDLLEILREQSFDAYVHAGSSSEYGLNSAEPDESGELIPNSHYAVSKTASYAALKYFGKIEQLPVTHLRLYSAYGPWEEPDRLIPVLIAHARSGKFPPLVDPDVSRDFIYVTDVSAAFIHAAAAIKKELYGEVFNIGTGSKTTIRKLAQLSAKKFGIKTPAHFGKMPNRKWDVRDWYANISSAKKKLNWSPEVELENGLDEVRNWQEVVNFDSASWNWKK